MSTDYTRRVTERLERKHRMRNLPPASRIMDSEFTRQTVSKNIREASKVDPVLHGGGTASCTVDRGIPGFRWLVRWITGSHSFVGVYDSEGLRVNAKWCTTCGQTEKSWDTSMG